jgi:hypothetical protein
MFLMFAVGLLTAVGGLVSAAVRSLAPAAESPIKPDIYNPGEQCAVSRKSNCLRLPALTGSPAALVELIKRHRAGHG